MEGVMKTMLIAKLKGMSIVLLAVGIVTAGLGAWGYVYSSPIAARELNAEASVTAWNIDAVDAPARAQDELERGNPAKAGKPRSTRRDISAEQRYYVLELQLFEQGPDNQVHAVTAPTKQALTEGKLVKADISQNEGVPVLSKVPYLTRLFQTTKVGVSYQAEVRRLDEGAVALNLLVQTSRAQEVDEDGTVVHGKSLHVMRKIKIGKLERFAFDKDSKGKMTSWVEMFLVLDGEGLSGAFAKPISQPQSDQEALQGNWQLIRAEHGGAVDAELLKRVKNWRVEGDKMIVDMQEPSGNHTEIIPFQLETNMSPKRITLTEGSTSPQPRLAAGLFSLEGDTFKFCVCPLVKDNTAPSEFKTRPGTVDAFYTFKRLSP